MRVLVVYNPTAGRRRLDRLRRFLDVLRSHGVEVLVSPTRHAGHAPELVRAAAGEGFTHVIAAGGDGTIGEVAAGLMDWPFVERPILGILPLGTANVLAHEIGVAFRPDRNAASLLAGRVAMLHPGLLQAGGQTRLFLQMAGVGFDAQVVHRLSLPLKRRIGRSAYAVQSCREVGRYPFPLLDVTLDGQRHAAFGVIVSKGRYYGGRYTIAPDATPHAPGFTVTLLDRGGAVFATKAALALLADRAGALGGTRRIRAQRIEVASSMPVPVQCDGDPAGHTPAVMTAAMESLRVIV